MRIVSTTNAPAPAGHYAQAVVHDGFVFTAGQLPIDPETGKVLLGSIEGQTRRALENLTAVLAAAGAGLGDVLKVTVFVSDISLWDRVDEVYTAFFGPHRPARSVVPTRELHHGAQVEIEAIASAPR